MTAFPWEAPERTRDATEPRTELQRDLVTGLWPGQEHPMDAPDFLNRAKGPPATNRRS